ncbi:DNA methyltransferase [Providencia rettgeri]
MTKLNRKAIYTRENEEKLIAEGYEWNFHDEKTTEHLHSLHPYPAKFIPQIPRKAIQQWTIPGDVVYDPFNGCGTTVLEASLAGRQGIGTDNNAIAILASKAKTTNYTQKDFDTLENFRDRILNGLDFAADRPDLIPQNKNFHYWFDSTITNRLASLKGIILEENNPIQTLLLAIFSSIIVRVSYQDSDTRYSRIERKIHPREVDTIFLSRLNDVLKQLPTLLKRDRGDVNIFQADSRHVPFIKDESVSLIVTSPPYLNAYDYHKYHRQRLHWIGGDDSVKFARDNEIGSHDKFTRNNATPENYFSDMKQCFKEWSRVLKNKGKCLIIVGDAIVSKQPVHVGDCFVDLMEQNGFITEKRWIRTLHSTKRAFNVQNSRISHEHVLLFKKLM